MTLQIKILWFVAAVITLVAGLMNAMLSKDYPVSGTIGIEAKKVSYYFEKTYSGKDGYKFLIRSDYEGLKGYFRYYDPAKKDSVIVPLKPEGEFLSGVMPRQKAETVVAYKVFLQAGERLYQVPPGITMETKFYNNFPVYVAILYYIVILGGILFAVRSALEAFNPRPHFRRFAILTGIFFVLFGFFMEPLKNYYLLGGGPGKVLSPLQMFDFVSAALPFIWFVALPLLGSVKRRDVVVIAAGVLTVVIYVIFG